MNKIILLLIIAFTTGCEVESQKVYRHIGDIEKNNTDAEDFKTCHNEKHIIQYFNDSKGLSYLGEKPEIETKFKKEFIPSKKKNQNGYIRIRFVVNCKGETGRFRVLESDNDYKKKIFDSEITKQLLEITKKLDAWEIKLIRNKERDYYQYLIFKIVNGNIKEILP